MTGRSSSGAGKLKSSTSAKPIICPCCKSKPVARDPATGQYFPYCSRSCQTQATHNGASQSGGPTPSMCEQCKTRPKYVNGTQVHPYCGRTCSELAGGNGSTPTSPINPANPTRLRSAHSTTSQTTSSGPSCRTPGCTSPVFVDGNGVQGKYCTGTHRHWGVHGCISCRAAPRDGRSLLCRPCRDKALRKAPVIMEVPGDHESYTSVKTQFKESWRHGTKRPKVRAVYKIINTKANMKRYERYLDWVEAKNDFASEGKARGNENRRWHGTRRTCNIGDKGSTSFCTDSKCSLCCILKTSFDLRHYKEATGWGRFGAGIYTSSASSKADSYSKNESNSKWKALLLNKVVVGRDLRMIQDDTTLTKPPPEYDSVIGIPGGSLNYDEIVVYNNDAARPSYLVMYESR